MCNKREKSRQTDKGSKKRVKGEIEWECAFSVERAVHFKT